MLYRGTVRVSYTGNRKPIDELPDLPFDKIVLDGKIDEHVAEFLDENYPEIDHGKMRYDMDGGDSFVGFEYKGESPHSAIYIPSFSYIANRVVIVSADKFEIAPKGTERAGDHGPWPRAAYDR